MVTVDFIARAIFVMFEVCGTKDLRVKVQLIDSPYSIKCALDTGLGSLAQSWFCGVTDEEDQRIARSLELYYSGTGRLSVWGCHAAPPLRH